MASFLAEQGKSWQICHPHKKEEEITSFQPHQAD
jgi:hypothetical protein